MTVNNITMSRCTNYLVENCPPIAMLGPSWCHCNPIQLAVCSWEWAIWHWYQQPEESTLGRSMDWEYCDLSLLLLCKVSMLDFLTSRKFVQVLMHSKSHLRCSRERENAKCFLQLLIVIAIQPANGRWLVWLHKGTSCRINELGNLIALPDIKWSLIRFSGAIEECPNLVIDSNLMNVVCIFSLTVRLWHKQ